MRTLMLKGFLIVTLLVLAIMALLFLTKSPFLRTSYEHTIVGDPSDSFPRGQLEEELLPLYDGVETLVLFVGYARSGHSLVGAILDSHPEIIIPHEFNIIGNWDHYRSEEIGKSDRAKYRLFFDLHQCSRMQAMFGNRAASSCGHDGYCYNVPRGWQGTYKNKIKVIGDKKGSKTSALLRDPKHFSVLDEIQRTVKVPVKFIHVIRNPFDNIATKVLRNVDDSRDKARDVMFKMNASHAVDLFTTKYFDQVRSAQRLHQQPNYKVLDVYSREMVYKPKETLQALCDFLEVTCYKEFIEPAAKLLYSEPSITRHSVVWTNEQKQKVVKEMAKYPFMRPFTFDDY